jgi:hypothetical protein
MQTSTNLLSETQAAAFVSKSVSSLRLWRRTGKGPVFYKLGRTPKYSRDNLNAWLHANRIAPGA